MGTRIRIDQNRIDDQSYWEEEQEDAQPRRKPQRKARRRDIEERMEDVRLRRQIDDSYTGYDAW